MEAFDLVVVGASGAGFHAATAAAELATEARILLVGSEDRLPYKRTKVSKHLAAGFAADDFALSDEYFSRVTYRRDTVLDSLDPSARRASFVTGGGERYEPAYGALVLATGSRPRRAWRRHDGRQVDMGLPGVHFGVTALQIEALRRDVEPGSRCLVAGAGVLGVELSEQLRLLGAEVDLAGHAAYPMNRDLNPTAAVRLIRSLEAGGIRLLLGQDISAAEVASTASSGSGPTAYRIAFDTGFVKEYDVVVLALGVDPVVEEARAAGLAVRRGIVVDEYLQTSAAGVFACGDCIETRDGRRNHLWKHAEEQGRAAGRNAVGAGEAYHWKPYRLKCEVFGTYFHSVGLPPGGYGGEGSDFRGRPSGRFPNRKTDSYVCAYTEEGRIVGVVMVDDPDNQRAYSRAVHESWDLKRLAVEFELDPR